MTHLVMGFRRNRGSSIRPVHRIKHVIDNQQGIALGVQGFVDLAITVDAPTLANTSQVETGSKINGIYLKVECAFTGATGVLANMYMMVVKNPGANLTFPNANVVGADDNKRYVLHQEMVMMQHVDNSNPRTVFNGVIVIPRGYRRMGPADTLTLFLLSPGGTMNVCVQCHYKEFR